MGKNKGKSKKRNHVMNIVVTVALELLAKYYLQSLEALPTVTRSTVERFQVYLRAPTDDGTFELTKQMIARQGAAFVAFEEAMKLGYYEAVVGLLDRLGEAQSVFGGCDYTLILVRASRYDIHCVCKSPQFTLVCVDGASQGLEPHGSHSQEERILDIVVAAAFITFYAQ